MPSDSRLLSALALVVVCATTTVPAVSQVRGAAKPNSTAGKQAFASTCGGCHGLDGKGGERAPNIADRPGVQQLTDVQIFRIIQDGIPGTGMPAFHALTAAQVASVVAYVRTLQGTKQSANLPGDSVRGKVIFFGKAGCSSCHMVTGEGGYISSDLSEFARTHDLEQIRSAIIAPAANKSGQVRLVTVILRNGEKLTGRVRNEDNFSLQLQTMDGTFRFLSKEDVQSVDSSARPLMPSDYRSTLSSEELNDIIGYLMNAAGATSTNTTKKHDEWED